MKDSFSVNELNQIEKRTKLCRMDRRTFVKLAGATTGALAFSGAVGAFPRIDKAFANMQIAQVPLLGGNIPKYMDPLPHFAGIRVAGANLTVTMQETQQQVLPAGFGMTTVWAYAISDGITTQGPLYPAFTIDATRGLPTTVTYNNNLINPTLQKYLTVDQTLHWADPQGFTHANSCLMDPTKPICTSFYTGPVPAVAHLHGGEVPSAYDGGPDAWFTPGGITGPGYVTNQFTYPNTQEAATIWFHDHALGVTRLNVYAGLAGFYLVRDWANERNDLPGGPDPNSGGPNYEIEIVIQDRMFDTTGQWYFPDSPPLNPEHPYWIPEFLGDCIVVNGKTWPFLNVQPRRYRFRFLNGSNARFYRMWLENMVTATPGPAFWQIGTDGGLMDAPVKLDPNDPVLPAFLLMAPGERADIIIDFSGFAGQTLTLRNNARAPFPKGITVDPKTTGQIMQFRVGPGPVTDNSYNPLSGQSPRSTVPLTLLTNKLGALAPGVLPDVTRRLTLNEVMGLPQIFNGVAYPGGPLEVLVNNTKWDGTMSPNAGGITEMPRVGATEVWEIINLTADAHPIHLHLIQFQLLNRQNFNVNKYMGVYNAAFPAATFHGVTYPGGVYIPAYGPPMPYNPGTPGAVLGGNPDITPYLQGMVPPEPNEIGWKDTVIMYPGQVSRIVARFAPTDKAVGTTMPGKNDFAFDPTAAMGTVDPFGYPGGPGYVWHCHIIDHEDNEMMRAYTVQN